MKYKLYEKVSTIEKYVIKKKLFKKIYVMKVYFCDDSEVGYHYAKDLKSMKEYEKKILNAMNEQMQDFVKNQDNYCKQFEDIVRGENNKFVMFSNLVSFITPLALTLIYKNVTNLLLFIPIQILNTFTRYILQIENMGLILDDITKYELFCKFITEYKEQFDSLYGEGKINANMIDKCSLELLKEVEEELIFAQENKEKIKILAKERWG